MPDETEGELRKELADCVLDSSYLFCCIGIAVAIPLGVKYKSYNPLVYLGLGGTMLDLLNGYNQCQQQREALATYQKSKQ